LTTFPFKKEKKHKHKARNHLVGSRVERKVFQGDKVLGYLTHDGNYKGSHVEYLQALLPFVHYLYKAVRLLIFLRRPLFSVEFHIVQVICQRLYYDVVELRPCLVLTVLLFLNSFLVYYKLLLVGFQYVIDPVFMWHSLGELSVLTLECLIKIRSVINATV